MQITTFKTSMKTNAHFLALVTKTFWGKYLLKDFDLKTKSVSRNDNFVKDIDRGANTSNQNNADKLFEQTKARLWKKLQLKLNKSKDAF